MPSLMLVSDGVTGSSLGGLHGSADSKGTAALHSKTMVGIAEVMSVATQNNLDKGILRIPARVQVASSQCCQFLSALLLQYELYNAFWSTQGRLFSFTAEEQSDDLCQVMFVTPRQAVKLGS